MLLGQTPPSSDRVLFDGRPGSGRPDVAGHAGQHPTRERLKAFQAATPSRGWPLASWFRTKPGEAARIEAAMRAAGVRSLRDRVVGTLSSGEKARLWLARAIATGAPALIADDPFDALDPRGQEELMTQLAAHARTAGGPVIVTVRAAATVARFCTRLVLFDGGRVTADGARTRCSPAPRSPRPMARRRSARNRPRRRSPLNPRRRGGLRRNRTTISRPTRSSAATKPPTGSAGRCVLPVGWPDILARAGHHVPIDKFLFANVFPLPDVPQRPLEDYDLQIVQVPLPTAVPERDHIRLAYDDAEGHQRFFDESVARLELFLKQGLKWSGSIPTLVMNYVVPQQNLLGRLLPRYDLRNSIYFVERINEELAHLISTYPQVHLLDVNHIASVCGRRFLQEDALYCQFHGALMEGNDRILEDKADLERSRPVADHDDVALEEFVATAWREARAIYRTLRGIDAVKLVCVDLDNALWRGTIGEMGELFSIITVGWQMGLAEVLVMLRKRGIVLAIISKNDEARVRAHDTGRFSGAIVATDANAVVRDVYACLSWTRGRRRALGGRRAAYVSPHVAVTLELDGAPPKSLALPAMTAPRAQPEQSSS